MNTRWLSLFLVACATEPQNTIPDPEAGDSGGVSTDAYIPDGGWLWVGGVVKYHLSTAFKADANAMASFNGAVAEYQALTGLTFVEQTDLSQQTIWYVLNNTAGCGGGATTSHTPSSQPGPQIALCTRNVATTVHETGHALGMEHEQKRPDAKSVTLCYKQNIDTSVECDPSDTACLSDPCTHGGDFSVDTGLQRALAPFDFDSTMMYQSDALSKNHNATITANDGGSCLTPGGTVTEPGSCIAFKNGLSIGDINSLRQVYELPLDSNQAAAGFGAAIAVGDFDGDGFMDVAVGAPGNTQGGASAGAVFVYKGTWGIHDVSAAGPGLPFWGTALVPWMKIVPSTLGKTGQDGEKFGTSLKAVDLDGDGVDDLAIGAPGRDTNTGAVYVAYGHAYVQPGPTLPTKFYDGLSKDSTMGALPNYYTRASLGLAAGATGDSFGAALATGNFDNGTLGALAIGATGHGGGEVVLLKYTSTGMALLQRVVPSTNNAGDHFGATLSARDWDGDGQADIVVGAPQGGTAGAGKVVVFLSGGGFAESQSWAGSSGVAGDDYGTDLAFGDFENTGTPQLAVGAPGRGGSGRVQIMAATSAGHFSFVQQIDSSLAGDTPVSGDRFGSSLKATHLHGAAHADLLVGAPRKASGSVSDAGKAYTFLANSTGFTGGNAHHAQTPVAHARFGSAVNAADLDNDGNTDAVFGSSNADPRGNGTTGGMIESWQGSSSGLNGTSWGLWPDYENVIP